MMKFLIIAMLVIASGAWAGDIRIDGSSAASTKQSVETMMKALSEDEVPLLAGALLRIQLAGFDSVSEVPPEFRDGLNYEYLSSKLAGLSYEDILELAETSPVEISADR